MEYNTSGIRTKQISDETTYSYMPKQHILCKILPQHMIPGVLGFQGFFLRSGDSFHNASPFKPCKFPKKRKRSITTHSQKSRQSSNLKTLPLIIYIFRMCSRCLTIGCPGTRKSRTATTRQPTGKVWKRNHEIRRWQELNLSSCRFPRQGGRLLVSVKLPHGLNRGSEHETISQNSKYFPCSLREIFVTLGDGQKWSKVCK